MIELIAGGARSGKSRHAMGRAESLSPSPILVATATAEDEGMAERIRRHRQERGNQWRVAEVPLELAKALGALQAGDVVVVDCLTLWLSNWLCGERPDDWPSEKAALLAVLGATAADVLLVTNEVGQGVVPMGRLSREFVDQSGWLHQEIAAISDRVTLMHFGIPTVIRHRS